MSAQAPASAKPVVLSFSSAYAALARRVAGDLRLANIEMSYDSWDGGGGAPAAQAVPGKVADGTLALVLLTPSDAAPTWISERWRRAVYDPVRASGGTILPVLGDGNINNVPDFLRDLSYADLCNREYPLELGRVVETIREQLGNAAIALPGNWRDGRALTPAVTPNDPITVEVGDALESLTADANGTNPLSDEQFPLMRDGLFYELGVQFPPLQVRIATDLPPSDVRILINDIPEEQFELHPDAVMVNASAAALAKSGLSARPASNPANGAASAWIGRDHAPAAERAGLTVWDSSGVLILLLSSVLRRKAAHFVRMSAARAMLTQIESVFPQLVAETVPKTVSLFVLTDVLRRLVAEGVSIRDLRRILLALADWGRVEDDPLMLTEYARAALQRMITHKLSRGTNTLTVLLLDPEIERTIRTATQYTATGSYVALPPDLLSELLAAIRAPLESLGADAQMPQILTVMEIRSAVRRLVAPSIPALDVVSYQELSVVPGIQPIGRIKLDGFLARAGVEVAETPILR